MLGKHSLRKKSFKVLEQRTFQCDLPDRTIREGSSPASTLGCQQRTVQIKTSQTNRLPTSPDREKRLCGIRQSGSHLTKTSGLLHLKSQPDLKKLPLANRNEDLYCSPQNREEVEDSLQTLTHRLTKITVMQEAQRTALNEVITDLSKKVQFARQPTIQRSKVLHDQNRLQAEQSRLQRQLSVMRRSNAELRIENTNLRDQLNRLRKQKHLLDEVHKAEVSRLNLEISRLKILLFQTVDELNKEDRPLKSPTNQSSTPQLLQQVQPIVERINHVYTYEKYDKPRSSHLQRISEIDPKLQMSSINMRHQEMVRPGKKSKAEQQDCSNGLYSSQHIRLQQSTINTGTDNRNPSFLSNQIDFLEIDSKQSSGVVNRT